MITLPEKLVEFIPVITVTTASFLVIGVLYHILLGRHSDLGNERKFPRQIVITLLGFISLVLLILVLPIAESSRNQLMGLIGILVSGIIAFSSTNIVANLMAGILLCKTRSGVIVFHDN